MKYYHELEFILIEEQLVKKSRISEVLTILLIYY